MSSSLTVNSLSALQPVELEYSYNSTEKLQFSPNVFSNRLSYYTYSAFSNIQDIAISKKNALFLTGTKSLTSVFEKPTEETTFGRVPGTFFLDTINDENLQNDGSTLSVQLSSTKKAVVTLIPVDSDNVELYTNEGVRLVVDEYYPYDIRLSNAPLAPDQQYRTKFKFFYSNGLMSFQTTTREGPRFVSYGVDKILRAVGVMLNNAIINPYLFKPKFITNSSLVIGFDPVSKEVRYYNDIESFKNRKTLDIKEKSVSETNLLISCATSEFTKNKKTNINIALLRTNYTSTGTYAPSPAEVVETIAIPEDEIYLSFEDEITPILLEDFVGVGKNNYDGFLIYIE